MKNRFIKNNYLEKKEIDKESGKFTSTKCPTANAAGAILYTSLFVRL